MSGAGENKLVRPRNRARGFDWRAEKVVNPDRPLGAWFPGRVARDVAVVLTRSPRGGRQRSNEVHLFECALELNARWIAACDKAGGHCWIEPIDREVRDVGLSERTYKSAVHELTVFETIGQHGVFVRREMAHVRSTRLDETMGQHLKIRKVLLKGRADAALLQDRVGRFVRDNVDNNRAPGEAVLLRTFLPFSFLDRWLQEVEKIKHLFSLRKMLRGKSDVDLEELAIMALYAKVNAAGIYLDYDYLEDLLELAIYAGDYMRGFRNSMDDETAKTYRLMLCPGGEDPEKERKLWNTRATFAAILRRLWRAIPGLVIATQSHGRLREP